MAQNCCPWLQCRERSSTSAYRGALLYPSKEGAKHSPSRGHGLSENHNFLRNRLTHGVSNVASMRNEEFRFASLSLLNLIPSTRGLVVKAPDCIRGANARYSRRWGFESPRVHFVFDKFSIP